MNKDNKEFISINTIKEMYKFEDKEQPIDWNTFYNLYSTEYNFDKLFIERLYIHYLIIVGNYVIIHKFISDFINSSSIEYFETFINSPLYIPIYKKQNKEYFNNETRIDKIYHLYPVTTSIMWNNKTDILRLLIAFGATLDKTDNRGYYPEEAIRHIPYFIPVPYLEKFEKYSFINGDKWDREKIYYRKIDEFKPVIDEVRYITGEDVSQNWFYPI